MHQFFLSTPISHCPTLRCNLYFLINQDHGVHHGASFHNKAWFSVHFCIFLIHCLNWFILDFDQFIPYLLEFRARFGKRVMCKSVVWIKTTLSWQKLVSLWQNSVKITTICQQHVICAQTWVHLQFLCFLWLCLLYQSWRHWFK